MISIRLRHDKNAQGVKQVKESWPYRISTEKSVEKESGWGRRFTLAASGWWN